MYLRRVLRGAFVIAVMQVLAAGCGYFLRLLLARSLSVYEYGLVYAVFAAFGLFSLFQELGLGQAMTKYSSELKVKKKWGGIKQLLLSGISMQLISSGLIALIFVLFADQIAVNYIKDPSAAILIKVYAISIFLSPTLNFFKSFFQGFQIMSYYSLVGFVQMLFILVSTYIFLKLGFGIMAPIYSYCLAYITVILFYFLMRNTFPEWKQFKPTLSKPWSRKLINFGIPVIFTSVAGIIFNYTDSAMITYFNGIEAVGLYNAAMPTARMMLKLTSIFSLILLPLASELWAKKDKKRIGEALNMLYKYSAIGVLPVSILMLLYADIIINVLFGWEYLPASNVLRILSISTILISIGSANNAVLSGIGMPKKVSIIMGIAAFANFSLNLILIPSLGINGAAIATVTAHLVVFAISLNFISKQIESKIEWGKIVRTLIASIFFALSVFSLKDALSMNMFVELAVVLFFSIIIYSGLILGLKIVTIKEVKQILSKVL